MAHEAEPKTVKMNCVDVDQINLDMRLEQAKSLEKNEPTLTFFRESTPCLSSPLPMALNKTMTTNSIIRFISSPDK